MSLVDDLVGGLADGVEGVLATLGAAKEDALRRAQLADALGASTLELPDWLDGKVQSLRPDESRAEQLERILGLIDNFIEFARISATVFDEPISTEQAATEWGMRVLVPILLEIWRDKHPRLFLAASILLMLDERIAEYRSDGLTYDRFGGVLKDLASAFREAAPPQPPAAEPLVIVRERLASVTIINAAAAAAGLASFIRKGRHYERRWAFDFSYGLERETPPKLPETDGSRDVYEIAQRTFSAWWRELGTPIAMSLYDEAPFDPRPVQPLEMGFTLVPIFRPDGTEGIWFQSNITTERAIQLSQNWKLRVIPSGSAGYAITNDGFEGADAGTMHGKLRAELVWDGQNDPRNTATSEGKVRATMSSFTLAAFSELGFDNADIGWGLRAERFEVSWPETGTFIDCLFPNGGSLALDVGLRWTFRDGLQLDRGTGLEIFDPVHARYAKEVGGTTLFEIELTYVRLRAEVTSNDDGDRGLRFALTGGFAFGLLGVTIVVDGIGGALSLASGKSGNLFQLGNADWGVVLPEGLGARINIGAIEGGGYFGHDPITDRYSGSIDVKLGSWALRGVGFIESRATGGTSVVAVVNFQDDSWSPGFKPDGIGLIVATHRRGDGDALRAALETGDLDALLFPEDPLRRVPELVASLNRFFPLEDGTRVVGLALRFSYGLGLVRIRLAVMGQFGEVDKLFVAIIAKLVLPDQFEDVLAIEIAGVGEYTFGTGPLHIKARLRNSHVAGGELTGGALVYWGEVAELGSGVWASVGGYHPRYENVPPQIAAPERLMLSWNKGDDLEASLKLYVALTPGAFHFGFEMALRATLEGFGIKASLALDLLFTDDCVFRGDLSGELTILLFSRTLCGLSFRGSFTGFKNICADITAKVSFLFWSATFPYSKRLTEDRDDPGIFDVIDDRIRDAFATGWFSEPDSDVVSAKREQTEITAAPHRALRWEQKVAPLDTPITHVGPVDLGAARAFVVDNVAFDGGGSVAPVRAPFPRGQFYDLSDDDRLVGPPFADEVAGFQLHADPMGGDETTASGDYQEIIVDRGRTLRPPRRFLATAELVATGLTLRADAPAWHRGPANAVAVAAVDYRVVGTGTRGPVTSYENARRARVDHTRLARVIR